MKPLQRQSEPYGALGNVASAGVRNQLGRPRLDPLAVFVREGVQNCWDAHLPEDPHVEVEIGLRTLTSDQVTVLQTQIFADPAPSTDLVKRLAQAAAGESPMRVLWIADRNTSGLGGPTRANVTGDAGVPTDFVDLLRNVGQPPDKDLGGGTFGFGKGALFKMSRLGMLLVHTHCRDAAGEVEPRLMGVGLGPQYLSTDATGKECRFTGRHWWGVEAEDGIVDPALDAFADDCAAAVGLPEFSEGTSGTTMAILDPRFTEDRDPRQAMHLIVESLLWNFWPKMIATDGRDPAMRFAVQFEDEALPIPSPRDFPPLDGFVAALENLDDFSAGRALRYFPEPIPITRSRKTIGVLSLVRMQRRKRLRLAPKSDLPIGGITRPASSHVALMRSPRLIVTYRAFEPLQSESWEYAGVFLATDDSDRAFARSEPPTHDDWVVAQLTDSTDRSIVRLALERLGRATREFADPTATMTQQARSEGLAPLSARLGALLVGVGRRRDDAKPKVRKSKPRIKDDPDPPPEEPEAPAPTGPSGGTSGLPPGTLSPDESSTEQPALPPGRPTIKLIDGGAALQIHEGRGVLATTFTLKHGVRTTATRLRAQGWASLEGGVREKEPPAGAPVPEVVAWRTPDGALLTQANPVATLEQAGEWTVLMSLLDDASIDVTVRGEGVAEAPA